MTAEMRIPLHDLREITNGFSVDSRIGKGGYGDVYKGVYNGREVAVKLLNVDTVHGIDDQQYINEVGNLSRAKHPNIIQLLGYSYETISEFVEHNSKERFSQHIYRALCFEYLQGGSLDVRLREKSLAPDWSTCYNIIKGICEGLNFLHGCKPAIFHLDLKPANILLDNAMVPKVADFGLSRVISQSHTQVTKQIRGTQAYMPPEFINGGNISHKNDVFSLGLVMIEIMRGSLGYSNYIEMDEVVQFKQKVHTDWKNRIKATSLYPLEELHQVQTCIDTAMRCLEPDRNNRPTIAEVLDMLNKTETHIPKRQTADVSPCPAIGPKSAEPNRLKMMVAELEKETYKHENCNSMQKDSSNRSGQKAPDRDTSSYLEEELIIVREKEKQEILSTISRSMTEQMVTLPIYGIGGIGKTTLAQLVFNDPQFQDRSRVWVYVAEPLDLKKIGNSIITQLTDENSNVNDLQIINRRLEKLFSAAKRILIVLDDLWEKDPCKLKKLKDMLRLGQKGKVIVVTTRDADIAKEMCDPAVTPYKLEILTVDKCWTIIKQKAKFEDRVDQEQLEQIGREIATKCGGVALAAQSLGYLLRGLDSDQWESVRDSHFWSLPTPEGSSSGNQEVLSSLRVSYSHMPDWLKLCFSYCAVFPKGHIIVKYDLIHQWIALGFTEQSNMFDSMKLFEKYVTWLLGVSFLQYSNTQPSSNRGQNKDDTLFTMHDLVHDLAKEILSHQINTSGNKCRYALLTDCSKSLQLSVTFPANIKALHFRDCRKQELCGGAFSPAKYLRVLDLSDCFIKKLPDCIGQLKQLRFLHAPRIQDKIIPNCITELSELNYLNLRGSRNISTLPETIGDMKCLVYLDLSHCVGIHKLPISFVELKQLVHLDLPHCSMSILEALGGFTKLQYLKLYVIPSVDTKHIKGLPEIIKNLIKLRYLNLSGWMNVRTLSEDQKNCLISSISTLSNLEHLNLSENRTLFSIPESIGKLTKLHTLDLSGCYYLNKLPDSMVKLVNLKILNVEGCSRLDKSELYRLNFITLPHFVVHASSDRCSSNIILLQPTNPEELTIDRLENVNSAKEAQSIRLIEKQKIKRLTFQWTVDAERFVDDKEVLEQLVPPSSVQRLYISGYRSVSIPNWLMGIRRYFPNLGKIDLCDFPKCKSLPPLCQLPNLMRLSLCRMESLEEWNTSYTSDEEGTNELMFRMLENLKIHHCAKLRIKPCLPRAMTLDISDCDTLLSSWGETTSCGGSSSSSPINNLIVKYREWRKSSSRSGASSSSPITDLTVRNSKVPMHQWRLLYHLPALRKLTIGSCSDLTTSSEIIQHLSSLESLCLESLSHEELPRWLVELTSLQELSLTVRTRMTLPQWLGELTSLKKLEIFDYEGIRSLPDSIQQLNKLEYLGIHCRRECPLKEWCKSKKNKMKLAHIRKIEFVGTDYDLDEVRADYDSDEVRA